MKEGWMNNLLDSKGRKKSRTASIVFLAIFVVTLVLSIVLGAILPRAQRVKEIDDTRFTSVFYAEADEWFYSTEQHVVRLDMDNDVKETLPLVQQARNGGINAGQIKDTYASPEGEYMWAIASNANNESKGFIFKLQDANGKLTILETVAFDGKYSQKVVEANGYLYVFAEVGKLTTILKYDVDNISQGAVAKGALYQAHEDEPNVTLAYVSTVTILSVDVIDDCLHVLHSGGLIRMSTDFEYNNYKFTYWEKRQEIYDKLFEEAQKNGEPFNEANVLDETYAALGIQGYDESTDAVTIALEDFDYSKYGYYVGNFSGGAYVEKEEKYYVLTTDRNLYSCDVAYLNAGLPMHTLEYEAVPGVELYAEPETAYPALFYNPYTCKGYVVYSALSEISCINFNDGVRLEYTVETEFDINRIAQIGDNLYYFYFNRFQTERAGQTVLKVVNIERQLQYPLMLALLVVSIVLCVFSGLMTLLFVLCWKKDGQEEKVRKLFKRIVKNKWVYVSMIPSVILLFSFCYYPAIESIRLSFFEYSTNDPTMRWNNFENYKLIFNNPYTTEMFLNLFLFLGVDIVTSLAPPLVFAFFLTVMRNKGYSQLVRTLLFIPGVIPGIAGMLIWREGIFSNDGGVLHMFLSLFTDNPHPFLTLTATTRFEILLIGFPYVGAYLIFYGGMMNISESYYEAAELEGIGIWKRFFSIDIPLILPQIKYIFITNFRAELCPCRFGYGRFARDDDTH